MKLGKAAKLFLPLEVEAEESVGFRIEDDLEPMDVDTFKETMRSELGPEHFPELRAHPFQMADGSTKNFYLFHDSKKMPRIIMWRQSIVSGTEQKLAAKDGLDSQHGHEYLNMFQRHLIQNNLPMHIPTIENTRTMVQQRRAPPEETTPSPGLPAAAATSSWCSQQWGCALVNCFVLGASGTC